MKMKREEKLWRKKKTGEIIICIDTKPLTAQQKAFFEQGLHNLDNSIKGVDFNKVELELKIPRSVFVTKVTDAMKNLEPLEQRKVMDYYGFEIENGVLKGYPINLNNGTVIWRTILRHWEFL